MATLAEISVTARVAFSRSGSSSRRLILLSAGCRLSVRASRSAAVSEKNAMPAADEKLETNNKRMAMAMETMVSGVGVCTVMPSKKIADRHKKLSGSKDIEFS